MSDTTSTFDFKLYDQFFKSIIDDLDKKITEQFKNKNTGKKMDFNEIQDILKQADTMALNMGDIVSGLGQDERTHALIKEKIDESMKEIKGKINQFKAVVADKKENSKLDHMVEKNIDKGKTNKVLKETAEFYKENGKYKRDDVEDRIKNAKREKETAEKMLDQRKDYDDAITAYTTANPSSSRRDAEIALNDEFKNLKTVSENWRNEAQRLQRIGDYDYENKLEDLIDLANNQTEVTDELAKEFKMFRKRVEDFSNNSISQYFTTIDKDPKNENIDTIRNILNNFSSLDLQNESEIKEPQTVLEAIQNDYKDLVNGAKVRGVTLKYIFEAFPQMQEEILSGIEDGDTKKIDTILKETRTMLREFPKKSKDVLEYEKEHADKKIVIYENEKCNMGTVDSNASTERPEAPEDNITDELDLTDLVLEGEELRSVTEDKRVKIKVQPSKITGDSRDDFDDEGNKKYYDFSTSNEENMDRVVNAAYEALCEKKMEHKEAINMLLPTVPKTRNIFLKSKLIRYIWNKHLEKEGQPTVEEKQTEKAIKDKLREKIEGRIAKGEENAQYAEELLSFDKRVALTKEDQSKFNQAAAKIIADHVKNNKAEINKKEANDIKKAADEKMLER